MCASKARLDSAKLEQIVHIGRLQCVILCMVTGGTAIVNSLSRARRSLAPESSDVLSAD